MSIFLSCGPECGGHKILGKGKMFLGMVHSENLECWICNSGTWSSAAPSPQVRHLYSPRTSCGCCRVKQCSCAWGRRLLSWPSDSGEPYWTEALHTRALTLSLPRSLCLAILFLHRTESWRKRKAQCQNQTAYANTTETAGTKSRNSESKRRL